MEAKDSAKLSSIKSSKASGSGKASKISSHRSNQPSEKGGLASFIDPAKPQPRNYLKPKEFTFDGLPNGPPAIPNPYDGCKNVKELVLESVPNAVHRCQSKVPGFMFHELPAGPLPAETNTPGFKPPNKFKPMCSLRCREYGPRTCGEFKANEDALAPKPFHKTVTVIHYDHKDQLPYNFRTPYDACPYGKKVRTSFYVDRYRRDEPKVKKFSLVANKAKIVAVNLKRPSVPVYMPLTNTYTK